MPFSFLHPFPIEANSKNSLPLYEQEQFSFTTKNLIGRFLLSRETNVTRIVSLRKSNIMINIRCIHLHINAVIRSVYPRE